VTYTPQTGFVGTDTFSYTENDGTGTATGQVTVTVDPAVNSFPPVATADTAETAENTAVGINVLANDSSPNGGTLTITGVTQGAHGTVAIASVTNSALSISSGQEIDAGSVLAYNWNQPWTVMAQIDVAQNPDEFGGTAEDAAVIFTNVNASPYPGYELWIDSTGHLRVRIISNIFTGNYIDVESSFVVTDGNWHDVAVSYDGSGSASGVKIYVDGHQDTATTTLVNSLTGSIVSPTDGPLIIGNQTDFPYALDGLIEQFSISDVVRSAAYIAQYASIGSVAPVDANTALDYNFNHNTGVIVDDQSSNGYNGTLSSSAMWTSGPSLPEVTYTPQAGFVGSDTFSYTESNGTGTATGQVTVTVNPTVNPVATADTAETAENTAVSINVLANDSSPNGGTLTITGVTQGAHGTVAIASVTNSALSISSGQEIDAGAVLAYDRNQPWTVMAQIHVAQNPAQVAVIASNLVGGSGSAYPGYEVFIDPTGHLEVRLISNFSTGNYIDVESSFVVTDGNWHDIAVSYDGSSSASGVKIYVDGHQDTATTVLANSLTGSIVSPTDGPLIIGNQTGYESSYELHGALEQFSISDVVRSAAYIAQYSSIGSVAPVDANTALDYNFNHNTGTIAQDLSSNGDNGTISSSAMWTNGPSVPEVTYTPQTGFVGSDTFSYSESDGTGTAIGQVTLTVDPTVNSSPPVAAADTAENTAVSTNALASDSSPSGDGVIGSDTAIAVGATVELASGVDSAVKFAGPTGTLVLDQSTTFTGQIYGLSGNGNLSGSDHLDLKDIVFSSGVSESYIGTTSGGTLTVNDGQNHTAQIALVGNYVSSTFSLSSDGHGGTTVIDPVVSDQASGTLSFGGTSSSDTYSVDVAPTDKNAVYLGNFTVDASASLTNGQVSAGFHFNFNASTIDHEVTQSYNVSLIDQTPAGASQTVSQTVSVTIGGTANDSFVFHPGVGTDIVANAKPTDTFDLKGFSAIANNSQLAELLHEAQTGQYQSVFAATNNGHDTTINLGNHDMITLTNIQLASLHPSNFII
jgi:large repetitive protein